MATTTPGENQLTADIRLLATIPGWNPVAQLRINSGSLIARPSRFDLAPEDWTKEEANWPDGVIGSYHPKQDWRPLTAAELTSLLGPADGTDYWNTVQLIAMPEHLLEEARAFRSGAELSGATVTNVIDCQTILGAQLGSLLKSLEAWLFGAVCEPVHWMLPEMRISPPGRVSSTGGDGRGYNGLHIDGWGGSAEDQAARVYNGSRIIFNVGDETRHLIFINLRIAKIVADGLTGLDPVRVEAFSRNERGAGILGAAFMEAFPNYPVIRVPMEPGQGYIAPTTAILHDGDLRGMTQPDVIVLLPHAPGIGPQRAMGPSFRPEWLSLLGTVQAGIEGAAPATRSG
jgi:hypothetical protein